MTVSHCKNRAYVSGPSEARPPPTLRRWSQGWTRSGPRPPQDVQELHQRRLAEEELAAVAPQCHLVKGAGVPEAWGPATPVPSARPPERDREYTTQPKGRKGDSPGHSAVRALRRPACEWP